MQLLFTYWVTQAMYGNEPSQLPLASLVSGIVWVQGFTFDATTQLACFFGQQQQLKVPLGSTTCHRPFAALWGCQDCLFCLALVCSLHAGVHL